jgi:hypothetical protein
MENTPFNVEIVMGAHFVFTTVTNITARIVMEQDYVFTNESSIIV